MKLIGDQIKNLLSSAQTEILMVCPFIKAAVFKEILGSISENVNIKCITRWLPEEIITGVSDLEIWPIIQAYPSANLWLRNDLHAKYYRADEQCLIGSANLTAKALGWSQQANLELLIQVPFNDFSLQPFEKQLWSQCLLVNYQLYEQYLLIIENFNNDNHLLLNNSGITHTLDQDWLPHLRNPEELYMAYSGKAQKLTTIAREAAFKDLQSLSIHPNLDKATFKNYVGITILHQPIIQKIDQFVESPKRFGAVRDLLATLPCANYPNFDPSRAWQTLMRWLLYFLPSRYTLSVPNYSEVFYKIA